MATTRNVRVKWTGKDKGKAKRAVAVGPLATKDPKATRPFTVLSQSGVPLQLGIYRLDWVFVGTKAGEVASLDIEQQTEADWAKIASDGPQTVSNASSRVGSGPNAPAGYKPVFFVVS